MKTVHKLLCILLSVLVLTSLAVVPTSAAAGDQTKTITVSVGSLIDWRDYFSIPNGYLTLQPDVSSDNLCASMVGEYRILCNATGVATFSVAIREIAGTTGFVFSIRIYIVDPAGYLAVFNTTTGSFSNGRSSIAQSFGTSSISPRQCPAITGSTGFLTGWTNGVTVWQNSQTIPLKRGGVTILNACWRPYTISLQPNMGTCDPHILNVENNRPIGEIPTPIRSGYNFDGWYTTTTGSTQWTADTIFHATGSNDVFLYAHWNPLTSKIKTVSFYGFKRPTVGAAITAAGIRISAGLVATEVYWEKKDPSDGEYRITSDTQFAQGGEYCLHIDLKRQTGFTLDDSLKALVNGYAATLTHPEEDVYVLSYRFPVLPKPIKVLFDANGGILGTEFKTMSSDDTYGELPTPVRPGYIFAGWFVDNAEGGKRVTENETVVIPDDHTLTAHWEVDETVGKIAEVTAQDLVMIYKQTRNLTIDVKAESDTSIKLTFLGYDPNILTVSDSGSVYANGVGTTEILVMATDSAGVTAFDTCTVVVQYSFWQQLIRIFLLGFLWY